MLVAEIERKQSKIDECQKYSEQYSAGLKVRQASDLTLLNLSERKQTDHTEIETECIVLFSDSRIMSFS